MTASTQSQDAEESQNPRMRSVSGLILDLLFSSCVLFSGAPRSTSREASWVI